MVVPITAFISVVQKAERAVMAEGPRTVLTSLSGSSMVSTDEEGKKMFDCVPSPSLETG